jgi:ABC-type phosphate transport system substrate-binding protein
MASMGHWRLGLVLLWAAMAPSLVHARQLALIADTTNTTTNLTSADLVKMFNAHTRTWPDGRPITIVLRDPSSADMQLVLRKVFSMTPDQVHAFIQAHKGAIVVAESDDAVIHFVSSTRGAVGVVDLFSLTKDVNVVKIDGKLPVEQGYLLRGN